MVMQNQMVPVLQIFFTHLYSYFDRQVAKNGVEFAIACVHCKCYLDSAHRTRVKTIVCGRRPIKKNTLYHVLQILFPTGE
jgi:hypothetical protein